LTPKLCGDSPEAALNSFESHGKSFRPFHPLEMHVIVFHPLAIPLCQRDLDKPILVQVGPVTPSYPDMAMPCPKDTRRNLSKFSHDS
jgi:hypothetical protein